MIPSCQRSRTESIRARRAAPSHHLTDALAAELVYRGGGFWGNSLDFGVGVIGAEAEKLDGVVDRREAGLGGDPLRPLLDDASLHLDAATADAAGQVVVVAGGAALPVQGLARRIADRVDDTLLAEHLQVPVDGGEPHGLALTTELGVDFLRAAEPGKARQGGGDGRGLLRPAHPSPSRLIQCHILQVSRPSPRWP